MRRLERFGDGRAKRTVHSRDPRSRALAAPEVRGDDRVGADGDDATDPSMTGCESPNVAVRARRGARRDATIPDTVAGPRRSSDPSGRVALRTGSSRPTGLGGSGPIRTSQSSRDHHGGEDDRAREEAASTCGNEPGVAQSRAILGGARRSDAQRSLRRDGREPDEVDEPRGTEVVERVDVLAVSRTPRCTFGAVSPTWPAPESAIDLPPGDEIALCARGARRGTSTWKGARRRGRSSRRGVRPRCPRR